MGVLQWHSFKSCEYLTGGSHLQRALARQMQHTGDIFKLSFNSAYMEGWALFYMLGEEEKKIRKNPAAQTTALLKEVFGRK
jgi:uncharacterized protein (DUF885 family)